MGKARPITIDTMHFAKAGDAQKFFSDMLARYLNGERVTDDDAAHLSALMKRHDELDEKIGNGVSHFSVDAAPAPYEGQRCFWITRKDGTHIDISYHHCLERKPYD